MSWKIPKHGSSLGSFAKLCMTSRDLSRKFQNEIPKPAENTGRIPPPKPNSSSSWYRQRKSLFFRDPIHNVSVLFLLMARPDLANSSKIDITFLTVTIGSFYKYGCVICERGNAYFIYIIVINGRAISSIWFVWRSLHASNSIASTKIELAIGQPWRTPQSTLNDTYFTCDHCLSYN